MILFAYATLHFANHALGNISVEAMDRMLAVQKLVWQSAPGALILYAALFTHMVLGFWALYERRQFRWTRIEATQLALGLAIPFLLTDHFVATRLSLSLYGTEKAYPQELYSFWVGWPPGGLRQVVLLLVVWTHGCIGMKFWLSLKPSYARFQHVLFAFAVLLPALALLGDWQGGRAIQASAADAAWRARELTPEHVGTPAQNASLLDTRNALWAALVAVLAGAVAARGVRRWRERRVGTIRLTYPDRAIRAPRGLTVLEASLRHDIPHAHVCGGRGRCSTCRIRVMGAARRAADCERRRAGGARPHRGGARRAACLPATARPRHRLRAAPAGQRVRLRPAARRRFPPWATSARSSSCSSTCAGRAGSPRTACPTTRCSSSTSS